MLLYKMKSTEYNCPNYIYISNKLFTFLEFFIENNGTSRRRPCLKNERQFFSLAKNITGYCGCMQALN